MKTKIIQSKIIIPDFLQSQVQAKLAYVDEKLIQAFVKNNGIDIELNMKDDADDEAITKKVFSVVKDMAEKPFHPKVEILEDYTDRPVSYDKDPMDELTKRQEVYREETGIYTVGPLISSLIDYFEQDYLALADHFDAKPYRFPTLISAKMLDRVGYFGSFPHSLSFATHLRTDLDRIADFAKNAHVNENNLSTDMNEFAKVRALLSPAVCYHLYFTLADKPLPEENITATAVGNCFRHESSNMEGLERLWDFTMREVIFVGKKDWVLSQREEGRKVMTGFLEKMGLNYHIESANDPFFVGEFSKQAAFQSAFQLKYEIRGALPFKQSSLAVGSYNYHQDFFGRHLNITLPQNGEPIHTGCIAFGLERMAYAFLAQHGFDKKKWPEDVRKNVKY